MSIFDEKGSVGTRTLRVRLPAFSGFAKTGHALGLPVWTPVRLSGREGVNSLFSYVLVLKAHEAEGSFGTSVDAIDVDLDS